MDKNELKPAIFERRYKDDDGVEVIWKYDLSKSNGPIEVINNYPKNWLSEEDKLNKSKANIPLTQQQFINPANGKLVGYGRAKQLGLI